MYRKTRYISAAEATWRMLGFDTQSRYPSVTLAYADLEQENNIIYHSEVSAKERAAIAKSTASDIMHYLPTAACFNDLTLLDYFETCIISNNKNMTPPRLLLLPENGLTNMATSFLPEHNMYAVSISKAQLLAMFSICDSFTRSQQEKSPNCAQYNPRLVRPLSSQTFKMPLGLEDWS